MMHRILTSATLVFMLTTLPGASPGQETKDTDYKTVKQTRTVKEDIEELTVRAVRQRQEFERRDIRIGNNRFFRGPYGDKAQIVAIGQELKNRGEKKRVFTRGIRMPQNYVSSSLDRYAYLLADACGLENFKFYEGDAFRALGLRQGEREIIFDVVTGGGPFSGPGVWGPYDQVVGKRHKMKPIMGEAGKDGLGLRNTGYMIGQKADLPGSYMMETGERYGDSIAQTAKCLDDKLNQEAAERVLSSN